MLVEFVDPSASTSDRVLFIVSVDDIICYGVKRKYSTGSFSRNKPTTSTRVLQELGKRYPVAHSIYTQCFER